MNITIKIFTALLFFCLATSLTFAQDTQRTISVSGTSSHNLSPNEIIIKVSYQEYFTTPEETFESKVTIEEIEKRVLKSLKKAKVEDDKITMGEVQIVHPYKRGTTTYQKRRINKSLYICINTTDHFITLIRQLEADGLLDDILTYFSITEYRHTEKDKYLKESRAAAFADAKSKAALILGESKEKVGQVISIAETKMVANPGGSFYSVENTSATSVSGFKPIVISYDLEVVFEIME